MAISLQEIYNEVYNNPKAITGLSWSQSDEWIKAKLSEIGASNETVVRETVQTADIVAALYSDVAGFQDITQLEATKLNWLSPIGGIDPAVLQPVFLDMFPPEGVREPIREALIALAIRSASRAEKLWGQNPTIQEVHEARKLS